MKGLNAYMARQSVQHLRGSKAAWETSEQILKRGELGVQFNNDKSVTIKVGDGESTFKELGNLKVPGYATTSELQAVNTRIDSLIVKPEEGEGVSSAEVIDIRNSLDGTVHESAGKAVRAVEAKVMDVADDLLSIEGQLENTSKTISNIKTDIKTLQNEDKIDGLLYKENKLFLTSKGDIISEPVEIVGGTGGGPSIGPSPFDVSLVAEEGTSLTFSTTPSQEAWISFSFTCTEKGVETGPATCKIFVGESLKRTFKIKQATYNPVNVAEFLTTGLNEVVVTCSDIYGNSRSLIYNITVVQLELTSNFNDTKIYESDIDFKYIPFGMIDKVAHIYIDKDSSNEQYFTQELNASVNNKQQTLNISAQPHGSHTIEAYLTATMEEDHIESNHIKYEFISIEPEYTTPLIASHCNIVSIKQGELISIPYMVYDPSNLSCDIQLEISYMKAGKKVVHSTTPLTVSRLKQYWNVRKYPVEDLTFKIIYGDISKSHLIKVEESDITVEPVTNDLQLFLTADGRSNDEANPAVWSFGNVTTTFTDFNWKSNGWMTDSTGVACLRLNGDAKATINFKPFLEDFKAYGKTIEFEFAIRNVNNRNAIVIDCFDTDSNIGIRATADSAILKSENTQVSCNYKDNEKLRLGFTVEAKDETRFLSIYLDGILSGISQYTETDNFEQINPTNVVIGSEYCEVDLYSIRVYDTALSAKNMVNNYIADTSDINEKLKLFDDNDIYDDYTGELSYKKLKKKIPTVTFIGKMPTYKGDKKKYSVRMIFEHPTNPELNFDEILKQIDVQGTSSAGYVRKNWKVKHDDERVHMEGELPSDVFCLKVDYAEATGTHNTQNANFAETLYSEKILPQYENEQIRTTITGYPIVIFHLDTDDSNLIKNATVQDLEARSDVKFSSKGNFNYDKDSENVFGFTKDYDVECWEFCNNTASDVRFLGEIPVDYSSDFEARYHPRLKELEKLEDAAVKDTVKIAEVKADMIKRFKAMHDWVRSTNQDQATLAELDNAYVDSLGGVHTHDTKEYRIEKFKKEFEQYFDLHYTSIYYVYTFFALMVDQRAKNLFLTYWHDRAEDGTILETGKWYPYFYDNDTSYGINNEGKKVFDYYHEDTDVVDGQKVYNGQDSVLWVNFRKAFPTYIRNTYAELRGGPLTADKLTNQIITKGSDMWSASVYNEDAEYKYVSLARPEYDSDGDGKSDSTNTYLYQVTGNGEHHFKYFIHNRLKYCDSKWYAGDYFKDQIYLRIYTPELEAYKENASEEEKAKVDAKNALIEASLAAVPPNANIKLTPFSDVYTGVRYKAVSGDDITLNLMQYRASKNQSVEFVAPKDPQTGLQEKFSDTETYIYGASDLSSLDDLSPLYCGYVDVSKATKLVNLKIGNSTPGYVNFNLTHLDVGANELLKTIDITNCINLTAPLDVSKCSNIEEIYAQGSGITSVTLPSSGYVRKMYLPETITNLTIKNQVYLETLSFENYNNLQTLCIDNCPTIDTVELLDKCKNSSGKYTVNRIRLTGINWDIPNVEFLRGLYSIKGLDEKGDNTNDAFLIGTCHIETLTGKEMAEVRSHYPYLTITYDTLSLDVTYKNETGDKILYEVKGLLFTNGSTQEGATLTCPVESGLISMPKKDSIPKYHYFFNGWTKIAGTSADPKALVGIIQDTTLYAAFRAEIRSYDVYFYSGTTLLKKESTEYGTDAHFGTTPPIKLDTEVPEVYEFSGWAPPPTNITEETHCYAQFYFNSDDSDLRSWVVTDFEYTLSSGDRLVITKLLNDSLKAGRIDNTYFIAKDRTVVGISGFRGSKIELVVLPDHLQYINSNAFEDCHNLTAIHIPSEVVTIADTAFRNTFALQEITVAESNRIFKAVNNCLINKVDKKLVQGCKTSVIPTDENITSIGTYAFWGCKELEEINIPDSITHLDGFTFTSCTKLAKVEGAKSVIFFGPMCFYDTAITSIVFPENTKEIGMYATKDSDFLTEITIKQKDTKNLIINEAAFMDTLNLKVINVPWSEGEVPGAPWGAPASTQINYNWTEV